MGCFPEPFSAGGLVPVGSGATLGFRAVLLGKAASVQKILGSVVVVALLGGLGLELLVLGLQGIDLLVLFLADFVDLLSPPGMGWHQPR